MGTKIDKSIFLQQEYPDEGTRKNYASILDKFNMFENRWKRDLYDFSEKDISEVLKNRNVKSRSSLSGLITVYNAYVDWARGYWNREPLHNKRIDMKKLLISNGLYEEIIQREIACLITRDMMVEKIKNINNEQDQVIIALLFEGVNGHEGEELRTLRKDAIFGRRIVVGNREIVLTPFTENIVRQAMSQTKYRLKNGEAKGKRKTMPLIDYGYLIKKIEYERSAEDNFSVDAFRRRIAQIKTYTGLANISASRLKKSGIFDCLFLIESRKGELSTEDSKKVCTYFGENTATNWNWQEYRSLYRDYKDYFILDDMALEKRRSDKDFDDIYEAILDTVPAKVWIYKDKNRIKEEQSEEIAPLSPPKQEHNNELESQPYTYPGIEFEEENDPEYAPNTALGERGEQEVMKFLKTKYPDEEEPEQVSVTRKEKFPGYDIEHRRREGTECIEVKATEYIKPITLIYLTFNELKVAGRKKDNYSLYIVYFNNNRPKAIYRIVNLFEILPQEVERWMHKIEKPDMLKLKAQQFALELKYDFLKNYLHYEWE